MVDDPTLCGDPREVDEPEGIVLSVLTQCEVGQLAFW